MNRPAALLCVSCLFLPACETTETTKPRHLSSTRGLQAETGKLGNKALVRESDARSLAKYNRVIIEDVRVVQPRNVSPEVKRATKAEAEELAERFEEILREELSPHYQITNRRGRNTLAVRATLTDLQPSKPGVFVFNYLPYAAAVTTAASFATGKTPGAGSTTVEAEVVDSYTRRQVYAIVDRFNGSKFQPHGLERWGQTEASMRAWSRKIRQGIQGATPAASQTKTTGKRETTTTRRVTPTSKREASSSSKRGTPTKERKPATSTDKKRNFTFGKSKTPSA